MNRNPLYLLISMLGISWACCGTIGWMYYVAANNEHLTNAIAGAAFFVVSGLSVTLLFLSKGVKTMSIFNKKGVSSTLRTNRATKQTSKRTALQSTSARERQGGVRTARREHAKPSDIQVAGESYTVDEFDWYFGPDDDDL